MAVDKRREIWGDLKDRLLSFGGDPSFYIMGDGSSDLLYNYLDKPKPDGWYGNNQTYNYFMAFFNVIERAKKDGIQRLMYFEDDVDIRDCFLEVLSAAYQELPVNWQMVYFGQHHNNESFSPSNNFDFVGQHLFRSKCHVGMQGLLIHESMYDKFLEIKTAFWLPQNPTIDVTIAYLFMIGNSPHGKQNVFGVYPNIVNEKPGFSYCANQYLHRDQVADIRDRPCK